MKMKTKQSQLINPSRQLSKLRNEKGLLWMETTGKTLHRNLTQKSRKGCYRKRGGVMA